jgi:hypothetical protein
MTHQERAAQLVTRWKQESPGLAINTTQLNYIEHVALPRLVEELATALVQAENIVRDAFFQAKHMDIYESKPYLQNELEKQIAAALLEVEKESFIQGVMQVGHDRAIAELKWSRYNQQAIRQGEGT